LGLAASIPAMIPVAASSGQSPPPCNYIIFCLQYDSFNYCSRWQYMDI